GHRCITSDLAVHLLFRWQCRAALEQVRYPLRLDLGYRHDRPDRLDEPDEVQPGQPDSKQSKGMPRACRTWHAAIPDDPAPMMHTRSISGTPTGRRPGMVAFPRRTLAS